MQRGEIIEINGRKAMVDEWLGSGNFSYHFIKDEDAVPVLEEFPMPEPVEEVVVKRRRRKKA